MLDTGTFEQIPNQKWWSQTWALGGVLLAAAAGEGPTASDANAPEVARRHVYIDSMAVKSRHPSGPPIDILAVDHVVVGTDWPVVVEKSMPERLQKVFAHAAEPPNRRWSRRNPDSSSMGIA